MVSEGTGQDALGDGFRAAQSEWQRLRSFTPEVAGETMATWQRQLEECAHPGRHDAVLALIVAARSAADLTDECIRYQQRIADLTDSQERLWGILGRTCDALKGQPPPLMLYSWHDLPEVATALMAERDAAVAANAALVEALEAALRYLPSGHQNDDLINRRIASYERPDTDLHPQIAEMQTVLQIRAALATHGAAGAAMLAERDALRETARKYDWLIANGRQPVVAVPAPEEAS